MSSLDDRMQRALNILGKWRTVFTGWQLGTRAKGDPEGDAVRDHREVTIMLRAEVSALIGTLCETNPGFRERYMLHLTDEAERLSRSYESKFPGMKATETGITMDVTIVRNTMKGWRP